MQPRSANQPRSFRALFGSIRPLTDGARPRWRARVAVGAGPPLLDIVPTERRLDRRPVRWSGWDMRTVPGRRVPSSVQERWTVSNGCPPRWGGAYRPRTQRSGVDSRPHPHRLSHCGRQRGARSPTNAGLSGWNQPGLPSGYNIVPVRAASCPSSAPLRRLGTRHHAAGVMARPARTQSTRVTGVGTARCRRRPTGRDAGVLRSRWDIQAGTGRGAGLRVGDGRAVGSPGLDGSASAACDPVAAGAEPTETLISRTPGGGI